MSALSDNIFQILHDFKITQFGHTENEEEKYVAIAVSVDIDPVMHAKLKSVMPLDWTLHIEKQEVPEEIKTAAHAQMLEQNLIRMPNREERRKFERSRK